MKFFMYPRLCVFVPCLLCSLLLYLDLRHKYPLRRLSYLGLHLIWICIFLFYLYMVLETTGIGTIWDIGKFGAVIRLEEINLLPFSNTSFGTCFLNAFMFMPLGFLLPLIWKEFETLTNVVLAASSWSLSIEICQLFNRRRTDIDDLLMNTLGAMIGFFFWKFFELCFQNRKRKAVSLSKWEAALYLICSIGGQFFFLNWYWLL